jgi:glycosyltransferase involved in cell wall biosynthesis
MRIALVNTVKPMEGSGSGIVEYAYQLYTRIKRDNDVDLIYALDSQKRNDLPGLIYANTFFRARIRKLASAGYDIIHITDHEIGFVAKMLHGNVDAKIITTIHDFARFARNMHRGPVQRSYNMLVKRNVMSALRFSDAILFNSSQTKYEVEYKFALPKKYEVINLGVRSSVLQGAPSSGARGKTFIVGYVGSFAYHKNVMMILRAARALKDGSAYRFMVYGTGIGYNELVDYKSAHGLKNVEFKGFAREGRIAQIYDSFDAFVCPSLYEGFGLPILEAQARGLPVIIYKYSKIPREVRRYCLEADDVEDMARIIKDLKENGYGKRLKNRATRYARSFTYEKTAEETLKVYNDMLKA